MQPSMFMHVFSYRFKCLLHDRETMFWTLLFSLVLATFFYFAFGNLTDRLESFNPIGVAVVDNRAYSKRCKVAASVSLAVSTRQRPVARAGRGV